MDPHCAKCAIESPMSDKIEGTNSSCEGAAIESLRNRNRIVAGQFTVPCSAGLAGLFFAFGSEARIS